MKTQNKEPLPPTVREAPSPAPYEPREASSEPQETKPQGFNRRVLFCLLAAGGCLLVLPSLSGVVVLMIAVAVLAFLYGAYENWGKPAGWARRSRRKKR